MGDLLTTIGNLDTVKLDYDDYSISNHPDNIKKEVVNGLNNINNFSDIDSDNESNKGSPIKRMSFFDDAPDSLSDNEASNTL